MQSSRIAYINRPSRRQYSRTLCGAPIGGIGIRSPDLTRDVPRPLWQSLGTTKWNPGRARALDAAVKPRGAHLAVPSVPGDLWGSRPSFDVAPESPERFLACVEIVWRKQSRKLCSALAVSGVLGMDLATAMMASKCYDSDLQGCQQSDDVHVRACR